MSDVKVLYTAEATVSGGRDGKGRTSDGRLKVEFAVPAELGGKKRKGVNPEQLFALGYAACFQNAMLGVARREGLPADDSKVTARVGIGPTAERRSGLVVELIIHLPKITDRAQAQHLAEEAHQRCPYSNAIRGNVDVTLTIA